MVTRTPQYQGGRGSNGSPRREEPARWQRFLQRLGVLVVLATIAAPGCLILAHLEPTVWQYFAVQGSFMMAGAFAWKNS